MERAPFIFPRFVSVSSIQRASCLRLLRAVLAVAALQIKMNISFNHFQVLVCEPENVYTHIRQER